MVISKKNCFLPIMCILLFLCQRLVLTFGSFEFSFSLIILPAIIVYQLIHKKSYLSKKSFFIYLIFIFFVTISVLMNNQNEYTSLFYLILIYFILCFNLNFEGEEIKSVKKSFTIIFTIVAVIAIFQFIIQFFGGEFLDIFHLIPNSMKISGFNNSYPIVYGNRIMKSNGMFCLEPSFLSQFMAVAIFLELKNEKINFYRIALYVFAIICSFAGTGILLLLFVIPFFFKTSIKNKIIILVVVMITIIFLLNFEYTNLIVSRVFEFGLDNSSANIRFINPYKVVFELDFKHLMFGNGAGSTGEVENIGLSYNLNALTKVMFEYGLLSSLLFIALVLLIFFKKGISVYSIVLLSMYLFLGGNLLQPSIIFVIFVLNECSENNLYSLKRISTNNTIDNNLIINQRSNGIYE